MVGLLTPNDEAQLAQTIEMFEVITQSQPQDYQSLEILKEAYIKLGREQDALNTSKRIGQAYVLMGQISSAILEYESILQRFPEDAEVLAALQELESKASNLNTAGGSEMPTQTITKPGGKTPKAAGGSRLPSEIDDGRDHMHKIFVDGKIISAAAFEECWFKPDYTQLVTVPIEPFIQRLADNGYTPVEKSLKILSDKCRLGYLPLDKYDADMDLARGFPPEVCRRWCVIPFDRMSKCILVATANPFNRTAAAELQEANTKARLLWYLASPPDIAITLKRVFR